MTQPIDGRWRDPGVSAEARANALLGEMTLSEKLAQLGSYWLRPGDEDGDGDVAPMQHAFQDGRRSFNEAIRHGLGQLTRPFGSAPVEPEDGINALQAVQAKVMDASRFGIPALVHEECLTGFTAYRATVYPTPIAWGATFNPELVRRMAEAIGRDMRDVGVHQGLSPLLDVVRDYRWGRVEETIGEDPYLVGKLGTAYVQGLQSSGVIATLKHFAGYSASKAGRNHAPVSMGAREFADVVLAPFEMAVREGNARSVMNSYTDVDGVPAAASRELLTHILRERWGFTGTVVSDYWAIAFLDMFHMVSEDRASSGCLALHAGIDVELPEADAYARLLPLIEAGTVPESLVNAAALRVLTQKAALGLLDPCWEPLPQGSQTGNRIDLDSAANRRIARQLADESIILLANNGVLPLASGLRKVALVGPCAAEPRSYLGCYSFPNHVLSRLGADNGIPILSLVDALEAALGPSIVDYHIGVPILDKDHSGIPAAVSAARDADAVVVAVGDLSALFGRGTSGEGCDAEDLNLPGIQSELVEAVLATGTPVILLVISGRPYALGAYAERCAAIVQAFMPGAEAAVALTDVLLGRVNPSGHLPVCVPRDPGGQPSTYLGSPLARHSDGISNLDPTPLFPFGHGLSYTTFSYDHLSLNRTDLPSDGVIAVTAAVTNRGSRAGSDVVQLYLSDTVAQVVRPVRMLVGFSRVSLEPGESADVTFEVHADRTAFTGIDMRRVVEPGEIVLSIGPSSEDLPLSAHIDVVGPASYPDAPVLSTPVHIHRFPPKKEEARGRLG